MNKIIFIALLILLWESNFSAEAQLKTDKFLQVLIMNDNKSRPLATDKDFFWESKYINTITFSGDLYYDLVGYRFSKLKEDSIPNNFTVASAFIFNDKHRSDTVYSDIFFRYWMIGNKTYSSEDDFLSKMFSPLYLGKYTHMRKGEN